MGAVPTNMLILKLKEMQLPENLIFSGKHFIVTYIIEPALIPSSIANKL